ncbi:hypothetical protein [Methanobrevibacter sp.]|uniref:hypothetical protein n=1 Tax=Methanobrevibacter sp. TaxID=66852 RepID=UPI00388E7637
MKIKLAVTFGILIWFLTYFFSEILNPILIKFIPYNQVAIPLVIIIVTGFFGIIYIRNIETNEVVEGVLAGIVFIIIDILLDYIFFIVLGYPSVIFDNYLYHLFSMITLTLLITTFLGYLAQMKIDLK